MNLQTPSRTLLCGKLPLPNPIFSYIPSKVTAVVILLNIFFEIREEGKRYAETAFSYSE